jgi:alpha-mannosidase
VLRLTLLRSPTWPDPDADRGHHHFSYAFYPHAGDWKQALTVRTGYEYNYKLQAMQVESHTGSLPAQHSFVGRHAGRCGSDGDEEGGGQPRAGLPFL